MTRFAVVLVATLLGGCLATTTQYATEKLLPISKHDWQQLQAALHETPAVLYRSLMQAGETRLSHATPTTPLSSTAILEPQAVLVEILTHTSDPTLLADSEFATLHKVVSGANASLDQAYALALADYLTQVDFACRQPIYSHYFDRRYASGGDLPQCGTKVPFSVLNRYDAAEIIWLDPKRVQSIHLLFASKSGSMASRFGHVALRLVVCPEDNVAGDACDANLQEHLVLGFRAHIDEFSLNTLKALSGDYKAYLFANHFMDVYEEYAIGEFREIYSLPLRLNTGQRELMVQELADIHWRYAGSYSFFTQNCATMMQNALRVLWPDLAQDKQMISNYLRPDSLYEAITSSPLAEANRLVSLEDAERDGYFFSSTRQFYELALNEVKNAMTAPTFTDLEGYLQTDPVSRRLARTTDPAFSARLVAEQHLREAQIMLEEYAILRSERLVLIEGARYFEEQDFLARADDIRSQLDPEHGRVFDDCLVTPLREQARPTLVASGIPGQSELPDDSRQPSRCQSIQSQKLLYEAISGIKNAKSEQWQRLNAISRYSAESLVNLNLLKEI